MGMFDYLRCKYPLPVAGANALEFQTKDTYAQYCDWYEIREDGTLWHEDYDTEDRSDPNAEGLMALLGSRTSINHRWEQDFMTGEVRFYTSSGSPEDEWIEFSVYFVNGKLLHLETISPKQEPAAGETQAAPMEQSTHGRMREPVSRNDFEPGASGDAHFAAYRLAHP